MVATSILLPEDCDGDGCGPRGEEHHLPLEPPLDDDVDGDSGDSVDGAVDVADDVVFDEVDFDDVDFDEQPPSTFDGPMADIMTIANVTRIGSSGDSGGSAAATSRSSGSCANSNEVQMEVRINTDDYPWEMAWSVRRQRSSAANSGVVTVASGPPPGKNYARRTRYFGRMCVPVGLRYEVRVTDKMKDGICCDNGPGSVQVSIDGVIVAKTGNDKFDVKTYQFTAKRTASALTQFTAPVPATPNNPVTFTRGDLAVTIPNLGIKICSGMSVRVLARANRNVQLKSGQSSTKFHSMPDAAHVFPTGNGGWVYVSNSEMKAQRGGVHGLYFDREGNPVDYKQLLSGTTRNCGCGHTPWGTFVTCEEYGSGQCWQVGE